MSKFQNITTKIDELPSEMHMCISEYLNSNDCETLSFTNAKLRESYKFIKWEYCLVLPHRQALRCISTNHRTIPFLSLRGTKKYSWIPFHLIKTLELHQTTNLEFSDLYMKIYEHVILHSFPRKMLPKTKKVIVNLNHSASVSFMKCKWASPLLNQKPNWPTLDIKRLPVEKSDYNRDSNSRLEFEYLLEHEWVEKYNNNLIQTTLLAKCVNILFKNNINFLTPNLRFLTVVITQDSNFSFSDDLPRMAPCLENFELIWILADAMNPSKRVPQSISSLSNLDSKSFPNLRRCSITIPGMVSSYSNDYLPLPDNVVVNAPIVTHFINKSSIMDMSQFQRYFKFPNLHMLSFVVSSYIRYSKSDLVNPPFENSLKRWNRPKLLEIVITNRSPFDQHILRLLEYLIVDLSITQLKIVIDTGFKRNTRHIYESLSFQARSLPVSKEAMVKHARVLVRPTIHMLDKLSDENCIDRFQYFNSMENIHILTYIISMGIGEPSSISEDDIESAVKEIHNKKSIDRIVFYGMLYEEILWIASKNKSIRYFNVDFKNPHTKVYSSELYFFSHMPIYNTKQILISFNVTAKEMAEEKWKNDLPGAPFSQFIYGEKNRHGDTPIQVCIDVSQKNKLLDVSTAKSKSISYDFWKPLNEVDTNFDGWC